MKTNEQWHITKEAAELYERVVARHILGPWAPSLVGAAHLAEGEHGLDLACGTGAVTRIAAQRVGPQGRVTGVDLNTGMISVARSGKRLPDSLVKTPLRASVHRAMCLQRRNLSALPSRRVFPT
jgi:ubiquinone/menaquinone biosynthesis C-methylase UbiE